MSVISEDFRIRRPDLARAFSSATRDRLLSTLTLLCSRSEEACKIVEGEMLVEEGDDDVAYDEDEDEDDSDNEDNNCDEDEGEDDAEEIDEGGGKTSGGSDANKPTGLRERVAAKPPATVIDLTSSPATTSTTKRSYNDEHGDVGDDGKTQKKRKRITEGSEKLDTKPKPKPLTKTSKSNLLRPRYVVCFNCDQEFDVTRNKKGDCVWHETDAEAIVDHDVFADHDPDCHGPYDQDWIRDEWPEAFEYECCGKDLTSKGCRVTKHEGNKC